MSLVLFEKQNQLGVITINKPDALNALSSDLLTELDKVLDNAAADSDLRCLILTGAGEKAFVAGADIKEINSLDKDKAHSFAGFGQKVFMKIESMGLPVIAAVNGFALGGGLELAMSCDFIFASEKAKFGLPECTLGLMPGFGGSVRLARKVSPGRALQVMMTGDMISAEEAYDFGLVNEVCAPEELMERAKMVATTIGRRAPLAIAAIKRTVRETYGLQTAQAMTVEQAEFAKLFESQDCKEGTTAFIEKRKPNFTGQ